MTLQILWTDRALKDLARLDRSIRERVVVALDFVASINGTPLTSCTAKVRATNKCCFTVTCEEGFDFWIGDANGDPAGDSCKVTENPDGCSFNPIIFYTKNASVVP